MKKLITVVGARPQFIKASAVSRQIQQGSAIEEKIVHTGQHYDSKMSDQFFEELSIQQPSFNLGIGSASHGEQTGKMLAGIEKILIEENPDGLLVYGDTNSTLAGALAASKLHIPVAHVEAGLRSHNRKMPEEINRILTDHVSTKLFTPTNLASENLRKEGFLPSQISQVGDVMFDVCLYYKAQASLDRPELKGLQLEPKKFALATIHRAENTDSPERLKNIVSALVGLAKELKVIWPLHPRTKKFLQVQGLWQEASKNLLLIEPQGYLDILSLEKNAALIATDSGGVQKEAFFLKTPCVTLRDETEWKELVDLGWNRLASPDLSSSNIISEFLSAIGSVGQDEAAYGTGDAASQIIDEIENSLW